MKCIVPGPIYEMPESTPREIADEVSRCKTVTDFIAARRNAEKYLDDRCRVAVVDFLNDLIDVADVQACVAETRLVRFSEVRFRIGRLRDRAYRASRGQAPCVPTRVVCGGFESDYDGTLAGLLAAASQCRSEDEPVAIVGGYGTEASTWAVVLSAAEIRAIS